MLIHKYQTIWSPLMQHLEYIDQMSRILLSLSIYLFEWFKNLKLGLEWLLKQMVMLFGVSMWRKENIV